MRCGPTCYKNRRLGFCLLIKGEWGHRCSFMYKLGFLDAIFPYLKEASAIPFAALTAWRALRSTARIKKAQRVLVVGDRGAVGFSAIQLTVAVAVDYAIEDYEVAIKGYFDAVLDTIGVSETERTGINLLKRGGHYMTLQGEAASLTDRYGLAIGLPLATTTSPKKQIQYWYSHGIEYWSTYMRADAEGLDEIRCLAGAENPGGENVSSYANARSP
ncbi:Hypothetical predicted protein [Olea europaea subsp. europaea]|uniref:Uncharacterized protein n=1 Tax=Olea europaea subsp. europaea TaxID=158383 RepID=A0A8S0UUQ3_OLEEU|nr:Hypothetical predicted protein [Olea europaea subsp. europaea]